MSELDTVLGDGPDLPPAKPDPKATKRKRDAERKRERRAAAKAGGSPATADDELPLADAGVASIDLERRRYGMQGAAFVTNAAAAAEEARGAGPSDLVVLAVEPGRLAEVTELLTGLGAHRAGA